MPPKSAHCFLIEKRKGASEGWGLFLYLEIFPHKHIRNEAYSSVPLWLRENILLDKMQGTKAEEST